jgi:uncharacterized ferredoxin-like protein
MTTEEKAEMYEKMYVKQKAKREQRKAAGLCMLCGNKEARPNRVTCVECAIRESNRAKERYRRRKHED